MTFKLILRVIVCSRCTGGSARRLSATGAWQEPLPVMLIINTVVCRPGSDESFLSFGAHAVQPFTDSLVV
jgi:hypothetical protein